MSTPKPATPGEAPKALKPAKKDFTDRWLKAIKPPPAGQRMILYDAAVPNFGIRISEKSTKENLGSFVLVTRFPGGRNPAARRIGDYPAMPLAQAREIAREWREDIRQGVDPKIKEAERQRKEALRRADTFAACFEEFDKDHLSTLRSGKVIKATIDKKVMPQWGARPISDIRRADIHTLIRGVKKSAPIGANRLLAYIKKFFAWAAEQEMLEASPAAAVKMPSKAIERDRVLNDEELRLIWKACDGLGPFGRAFKLMLLTGQRRNEVGGMTWRELDKKQKNWTIPRERTKANRAHEVPMSDLALSIIDECPRIGDFVFTTGRSGRGTMAEKGAKTVPLSGWGKAKAKLDEAAAELAAKEAKEAGDDEAFIIAPWHVHDLRRSFETNLAKLGIARIVGSKLLNHAEGGVTKIYDRHGYDAEKRAAMNAWADRLTAIVTGTDNEGGNVVPFTPRN